MASAAELRMMTRVARMYHTEGVRQPQIAARLGLSQARVSRLLKKAEEEGVVRITVATPPGAHPELEDALQHRYGLQLALVVDAHDDEEQRVLAELGTAAAHYLEVTLRSGDVVGLSAWSTALRTTVDAMRAVPGLRDVRVVQILGGIGSPTAPEHAVRLTARLAELVRGEAVHLPSPGVAGSTASARALREDPFVARGMALFERVTVALVGIGSVESATAPSGGAAVLEPAEVAELRRAGAVGDVCLRFFDATGRLVDGATADRVIGMPPELLRAAPRAVAVAGGPRKTAAIHGALRAGLVDVLITDRFTAERLIAEHTV
ncbi:sugar-binding transcriptional regulator [Streptomyces litchfieldiae]|uniref:Sugar-binding transcriptional regulator n=1 Tax=Streptomyces litchfieldiae TaxID=3075543 RepID=A0ABU2MSG2_9ACTN|nr:sugar-binding transcriptional regulator [Streptomyces sp. DSM 44938]MDT0344263.1 sugar-binding transcriptional regulator [Streptomyces sp. DSM 44938]